MLESSKVPALTRAIDILNLIARIGPCSAAIIIETLRIPKSTAYLLLNELKRQRFISLDHQENYCLWTKLVELSGHALSKMDLRELARPRLTQLMDETGLLCHLGIIDHENAYYILKVESSSTISVRSHEGKSLSLYRSGIGKCLLAWQPAAVRKAIIEKMVWERATLTTITEPQQLNDELERIRQRGWSFELGAGIFFVVYAFLGVPANLLMRKFGARTWIGTTTLLWGFLSAAMAWADSEAKFLIIRTLLGAAEAGFFPGMIYLTSQWFPQRNRASIMGLFYMGAPLALTLGSPLSGALLEMHGFMGHPGWFWMFVIEGLLAIGAGIFTFFWLDDTPQQARFLSLEEKNALIRQLASEEEKKVTSRLADALRNGRVWQLAIIYLTIQVAVYGLIFFLPTQVAALLGTKVGFTASVVTAVPWVAALLGTWLIPRYSDRTGDRRNVAAVTLLAAGIGIGLSGLVSPVLAILALCVAAVGFIAVQPVFWTMPTQLLSGTALAAGIGFVNLFGAVGGFIAPILRVKAETLFASDAAGLLTLAGVAIIGSLIIFTLSVNRPVAQSGAAHH
ncbi:MFS transporter [Salmonella enterica]|nr:MFS transporter [Salmonella enterica]